MGAGGDFHFRSYLSLGYKASGSVHMSWGDIYILSLKILFCDGSIKLLMERVQLLTESVDFD